jgi:MOSC domain-containing protein
MVKLKTLKTAKISGLWLYPLKSFHGIEVQSIKINNIPGLSGDRRLSVEDEHGELQNAKRNPLILKVKLEYTSDFQHVTINSKGKFELSPGNFELNEILSKHLGMKVSVRDHGESGRPDRPDWPGPSIISDESLNELCSWFEGISKQEMIRRFRPNLILSKADEKPFWEEKFLNIGGRIMFDRGELIEFKPCERCQVPSRNPFTADVYPMFVKTINSKREGFKEELEKYGAKHLYYFMLNSKFRKIDPGAIFRQGDPVELQGL